MYAVLRNLPNGKQIVKLVTSSLKHAMSYTLLLDEAVPWFEFAVGARHQVTRLCSQHCFLKRNNCTCHN